MPSNGNHTTQCRSAAEAILFHFYSVLGSKHGSRDWAQFSKWCQITQSSNRRGKNNRNITNSHAQALRMEIVCRVLNIRKKKQSNWRKMKAKRKKKREKRNGNLWCGNWSWHAKSHPSPHLLLRFGHVMLSQSIKFETKPYIFISFIVFVDLLCHTHVETSTKVGEQERNWVNLAEFHCRGVYFNL